MVQELPTFSEDRRYWNRVGFVPANFIRESLPHSVSHRWLALSVSNPTTIFMCWITTLTCRGWRLAHKPSHERLVLLF